jgi:hypothetical protein
MITVRGSATGADGIVVMPAPSRCEPVRAESIRRVGRVEPARAEPMAVAESWLEPRVIVDPPLVDLGAATPAGPLPPLLADPLVVFASGAEAAPQADVATDPGGTAAGVPQTLQ